MPIVVVNINDGSDRTVTGLIQYDRTSGGTLVIPSGSAFPSSPVAKELFWRSDETKLYRRDDSNTTWEAQAAGGVSLTNAAPADVDRTTAAVGVATEAARADHKHDIAVAVPTGVGLTNAEGTSTSLARADHVHALPWRQQDFVPTLAQVTFILSTAPVDPASVVVSINGVDAELTTDYTISGVTITWLNTPYTLDTSDLLSARYR